MKMGTWKDSLAGSLKLANLIFCYTANLGWDVQEALQPLDTKAVSSDNLEQLIGAITVATRQNITVLDLSGAAITTAKSRLGKSAFQVRWIEANILDIQLPAAAYDVWHDRVDMRMQI